MPSAPSPAQTDEELVSRLQVTIGRLARILRQQDTGNLGATATSLLKAAARGGPVTLGELAAHERVAPPTITKAVDKLAELGLLERVRDDVDRRVCRVVLTPAGRKHLQRNRSRRNAWLAHAVQELTPEDVDKLAAAVEVFEQLMRPR